MKDNYLIWSVCLGLLSGLGIAQEAYVTGNAKVKVESNTLVYFGDDLKITENADAEGVIENAGNIKIDGDFVNEATAKDGKNFISTWTDNENYGQVIINQQKDSDWLAMEKGKIDPATFDWGQFAVPFGYTDAQMAMQNLFDTNYSSSTNRYRASFMVWNNSKARFDHLAATGQYGQLNPGDYVIINLADEAGNIIPAMQNDVLLYRGVPTNSNYDNIAFNGQFYDEIGATWDNWKNKVNNYNERYHTYIDDKVRDLNDGGDWGKYHFQFGNPYTSNIDLSSMGTEIQNLIGVTQMTSAGWEWSQGLTTSNMRKATYDSNLGLWAGEKEALIVKPFEPFILVLDDNVSNTISFNDNLKTFRMEPSATVDPNGLMDGGFGGMETEGAGVDFYQLGLRLYNSDNEPLTNRVFVVATSVAEAGVPNVLEAEYSDFGERTGFYLAQEHPEGAHINVSDRKMDINTISTDYENKPIPMFFNREAGDPNSYYLKADLFYKSIFNELSLEDVNYADNNSFYFYDQREDVFIPITTDFNYYIAPDDIYGEKIRYEVYWNVDADDRLDVNDQMKSSTIVYKDQLVHKVRFNENWATADVKVYDLSGRNIETHTNVETKTDLTLNVRTPGVYFVRVVANTGEVYSQKILK